MSLIGHYRLNDASGSTAVATVGADGTYANSPALRKYGPGGTSPHGVKLSAASSHSITLPVQAITDPWTVSFFFATTETDVTLLDFTDAADDGLSVELVSGSLVVRINSADHTSLSTQNDGKYHHVAISYSDGTATIYVDGAQDGSTLAATDLAVAAGVTLGSGLDGFLSDVRFYDDAQDASGVAALFTATRGPVCHYKFDTETEASNSTVALDDTGNGFDGAVAAGTWLNNTLPSASSTLDRAVNTVSDPVTCPDSLWEPLFNETGEWSVNFWIKFTTSPTETINFRPVGHGATLLEYYVRDNGYVYIYVRDTDNASNILFRHDNDFVVSEWYMVTITFSGGTTGTDLNVYVDGQEPANILRLVTGTFSNVCDTTSNFKYGGFGYDIDFDDCRTYYRELSSQDVSDIYSSLITSTSAPSITTASTQSYTENLSGSLLIEATGSPTPTFSITGGADAALFSITSGGNLSFLTPPDYENPADADTNNAYVVQITATNSEGTDVLDLTINVQDVAGPVNTVAPVISRVS